jgi:Na+/phosphate symporter
MSVVDQAWFWLVLIGVILVFIGVMLWGQRRKSNWFTWLLVIVGFGLIIWSIILVSRNEL